MKTNFKTKKESTNDSSPKKTSSKTTNNLTQEEFEDYVSKSGAAGSFMIFRSKNKKDELGIDEV
jgi:hypothetical protein